MPAIEKHGWISAQFLSPGCHDLVDEIDKSCSTEPRDSSSHGEKHHRLDDASWLMSAASMTISSSRAMDSHLPKVGESFIGFCECRGRSMEFAVVVLVLTQRLMSASKLVASHCDES
jgi:hypothetical protein